MQRRAWPLLLLLLIVSGLIVGGCQTGGADQGGPRSSGKARVDRANVPPPPGLDAKVVTPLSGDALARAQMTLEQVVETLEAPAFLEPQADVTPGVSDAEPPVAAQRAYIAGRLAWREGDSFEAITHLQSALRLAPRRPEILRLLGRIYTGMGNKVRGAQYFREAVQVDPTDLEGVFLLGRFALEQGDWRQAIAVLHEARQLVQNADSPDKSAIERLLSYYLATALMREGHAAAAIGEYEDHLANQTSFSRTSPLAREIELLEEQAGATWQAIGDLHHQLGRPQQAYDAYQKASDAGVLDEIGLTRRLLYTNVRLGLDDQAQALAIRHVTQSKPDGTAIGLVRYVIEQGAAGPDFAEQLAAVYQDEDRSASLVLALSDLLPPDEARALLVEHIRHRPGDEGVFDRLLSRYLLPDRAASSPQAVGGAIDQTAALMAAAPDHAESLAIALVRIAGSRAILGAFETAPAVAPVEEGGTGLMRQVVHGLAAADAGRLDEAQASFEGVVQADPDLMVARLQLAKLLIYQRRYDQAARVLDPLAGVEDPGVIALRVHVLSETGQTAEALELLDEMIREGNAETALVLQKARLQMRQGEAVAAERTLLDALNIHPRDERLYEALLDLYEPRSGQSQIPDSMRQWQRLVRRMLGTIPYSRIGRLIRAELHDAKGEFAEAEALLKGLLDENEHDARALRDLLELYLRANRRNEALALLENRVAENLDDPQLLALVGKFYKDLGEYEQMLDIVERLLLTRPDDVQRRTALAQLHLDRDQPAEALKLLESALAEEKVDEPVAVMSLLGEAMLALDRGDEAEKRYEQAIERFEAQAAELGYALAAFVSMRGDRERADAVLLDLLERFPDFAPANNDLGYNWVSRGKNLDRARAMIQKAVDSDPQSAAYLDSLGWAYYKLGQFQEAQTWLRRSRQAQGGQNPVIVDHLGDALYRLGNPQDAVRAWEEAILLAQTGLPARIEQTGNVLYQLGRYADAAHLWLRARAMTSGAYEPMDPEMHGMVERVQAKIDAVQAQQEPAVAPTGDEVGQGEPAEEAPAE